MVTLKLNDIVDRCGLNLWTTRYVLRNPELLSGMPEAGLQGVHRVFSVEQATRLAIATMLVSIGVPLRKAGAVVDYVEKHVNKITGRLKDGTPRYGGLHSALSPWVIFICDREFMKLVRGQVEIPSAEEGWLQISTWQAETPSVQPAVRTELNLTLFQQRLTAKS